MQVDIGEDRRNYATLRRTGFRVLNRPLLHYARLQPLVDESQQHSVTYPLAHDVSQVTMVQRLEEFPNIKQEPTCPPSSPSDPARLAALDAPNARAETRTSSPGNSARTRPPAPWSPPVAAPCPRKLGCRWAASASHLPPLLCAPCGPVMPRSCRT